MKPSLLRFRFKIMHVKWSNTWAVKALPPNITIGQLTDLFLNVGQCHFQIRPGHWYRLENQNFQFFPIQYRTRTVLNPGSNCPAKD